jgi:hypothetical protein
MLGRFRERVALVAIAVSAVAIIGLVLVEAFQPGRPGWNFGQTAYSALTDCLAALLSIGLLSLIFELFLRESFAESLRRFLRLNTALTKSGLVEISSSVTDLNARLVAARKILVIARNPHEWVLAHYSSVLTAASQRPVETVVVFPDPDSAHFAAVAESLDYSEQELRSNFDLAMSAIRQRWGTTGRLREGSTIAVKTAAMPLYDVSCADNFAAFSLDASVEHNQGGEQLVFTFDGHGPPVEWLTTQFEAATNAGEEWAGDSRTTSSRRAERSAENAQPDTAQTDRDDV